jgi:hypothetical protein
MADNVAVTAGTGTTIAADEVSDATLGSCKVQYVKLMDGTLDGTAKALVDASGLKVNLGADNDITGTVTAELSATDNAVLDQLELNQDAQTALLTTIDADTSTIAGDTTSLDAKIPALGQALAAASMPVVLPAAQITTLTPQTDGLTDTQLRATPVPVSGTVTANLSATDNGVLDTIELNTDSLAVVGGGTEATALRVTIANNSTGVLSVDDNGGSLTVDGTVTANLSATDNAVLDTIDAVLDSIDGKVTACNTGAVVLAAGTATVGKLGANSGVDIGDVDVASIAAGTNLIGDVGLSVRTSGGATPYQNLDVDESPDQVKATAGQIYTIHAMNLTAAPLYLKIYNAAVADVTVGTTTPVHTYPVPGNADSDGAGFTLSIPNGQYYSAGITIACTTGFAVADTGAPAANACIVNLDIN